MSQYLHGRYGPYIPKTPAGLIAMGWPDDHPTPELWNVVGWLAVFLAINIIQ